MNYPGGKGKCFQQIINILPPHRTYIETHLGGGSVLRNKMPAQSSIGIDLDPSVVAYWQDNFPKLATYLRADASEFLSSMPFSGDEVVYCDPPYLPETRKRRRVYRCDYTEDDHVRLIATLRKLSCFVVLSGYPSILYDNLLSDWNSLEFPVATQAGTRTESIWFNYRPPSLLHDASHLGSTFRERQTVKRRLARLRSRIERLSEIERQEVFKWLSHDLEKEERADARLLLSSRE